MKTRYMLTILQNGNPLVSFGINEWHQINPAINEYVKQYGMPTDAKYTSMVTDIIETPINLVRYDSDMLYEQREKANESYRAYRRYQKETHNQSITPVSPQWFINDNNAWGCLINDKKQIFRVLFKLNSSEIQTTLVEPNKELS